MEGVAARVPKASDGTGVKASLTAKRPVVRAVEPEPIQLVLALPVADVTLTEPVGLAWAGSIVHALPVAVATARRLGLDGWPERAFCGATLRPSIVRGGTEDPGDISCQRCLRTLRQAGLLR